MDSESPLTREAGITRYWMLRTLLAHLTTTFTSTLGQEKAYNHLRHIAMVVGNAIDGRSRAHHLELPLKHEDFMVLINEVRNDLHLSFSIDHPQPNDLIIAFERCPWEDLREETQGLCHTIACVFGTLAALNFGYARVLIEEPLIECMHRCQYHIVLTPPEEQEAECGVELHRDDIMQTVDAHGMATVPPLNIPQWYFRQTTQQGNYETLYHRQLELTHQLEQALEMERAAAEQLRTFNRIKQDFLSNVSHEFRTPITAIQGYLSLLEQGVLGPLLPEQLESLRVALRNLERLSNLVNDVLDFSSLSRGQFLLEGESVSIAEVMKQSLQRVEEQAKNRQIQLRHRAVADLGCVLGDREKLVLIVSHLLENAIKFSDAGKRVTLSAHRRQQEIILEVRDAGIGMTPEQLEHVFTPFIQGESGLSRRYGGLGMGLSLISNLVSLHNGRIRICSKPERGTTVRVTLPLLEEPPTTVMTTTAVATQSIA